MSNKALVEINVPASGMKYDVFIPLDIKMSDVLQVVAMSLTALSDARYKAAGDAVLCDAETGAVYDVNREAAELGIKNGSRLLLI